MKFWAFALLSMVGISSFASLPTSSLQLACSSGDGLSLTADLPWEIAIKKDGEWEQFVPTQVNGDLRVSSEWSVVLNGKDGQFVLSTYPKTVKYKTLQYGYSAVFYAKVTYSLPHMRELESPSTVLCVLRKQI